MRSVGHVAVLATVAASPLIHSVAPVARAEVVASPSVADGAAVPTPATEAGATNLASAVYASLRPAPQPEIRPEERVRPAAAAQSLSSSPAATPLSLHAPAPASSPAQVQQYVVEPGDTVRAIAERFNLDVPTVLGANPELARDPDRLAVGMQLAILPTPGALVTVSPGDTLARLAEQLGVDSRQVAVYNGLADAEQLPVGAQLIFPGAQPRIVQPALAATEQARAPAEEGEQRAASASTPAMRALPLAPAFSLVWPVRGVITTYFGEVAPTSPRGHAGLDIAAPNGTAVVAAEAGEVLRAGDSGDGYGILVVIRHADGRETWYAHQSAASVSVGERVSRGQPVGQVGSTGYSTGNHLHFELRENDTLLDPLPLLP